MSVYRTSIWGSILFFTNQEISLKLSWLVKNAPRGLHCGGVENVAIATRHRRRMSQATFFILSES